jgi:CDP-glucose 4,6-dehydratase
MEGLGMTPDFWRGKRILVTGHTGFKGSWLCLWLQRCGASVCGYSLDPPTQPNLFDAAQVGNGMTSITGDVRDLEHLKAAITKHQLEIVIHMAAQSLVRHSYSNPVETYATNVMGTVNMLEAVRQTDSVKVVLIITSDKCYENKEWLWGYRENDPMGGHDPYSSSKGCAELIATAYRKSYFSNADNLCRNVAVASTRAGNVVGGGDWAPDRLIPDIMNAFMENQPVNIRYPNAIRPWQHALEPLRGYLRLAEKLWHHGNKFAGAWNFGPNDEDSRPVSWIANYLSNLWGGSARWELDSAQHPHEATYLKLDCSKAKSLLNWAPKLTLPTTLEWIVEWYRAYLQKKDMREVTETEISRYETVLRQ